MDLKEVHDKIQLIINKDVGKYYSHEEIDEFLDLAQMDEFNLLSAPVRNPDFGLGKTQRITEELLPFHKYTKLDDEDRNDEIGANTYELPLNTMYVTMMHKDGVSVDLMEIGEIGSRLNSEIIPPTESEPIAHFYNQDGAKRVRVYPVTVTGIEVYYLVRPQKPAFTYTQNGRELTYDQANSTQLKWNDGAVQSIIQRALGYMGVNLAAADISQYGETKQQTGR